MNNEHILVIGAGSAGKRHAKNLADLGCSISIMDPRADRVAESKNHTAIREGFESVAQALSATTYDGFVIASPPHVHLQQIKEIRARSSAWILCEKPLSTGYDPAMQGTEAARNVLLGYTYRWWPPLGEFKHRLDTGAVGAPLHARFVMSAHLADWHPWERYQDFFMASRELGGGALLDESHFLDLMVWLFGWPTRLFAQVEKISPLEINTDDNVDILVSYGSHFRVNIHLDLVGRPYERSITVVGEKGTLRWAYEENAVKQCATGLPEWEGKTFTCERNEMFAGAASELLELIRKTRTRPTCSFDDGLKVMQLVEACRKSSATRAAVDLP